MASASVPTEDDAIVRAREDRARARWSILKRALLGTSPPPSCGSGGGGGRRDENASTSGGDVGGGMVGTTTTTTTTMNRGSTPPPSTSFSSHSMNAFPGFCVLDRRTAAAPTFFIPPPSSDVTNLDDDGRGRNAGRLDDWVTTTSAEEGGGGRHVDDGNWIMVSNSYRSSNGEREVRFLTREASRPPRGEGWNATGSPPPMANTTNTVHDRIESLLSHRRYGVDNTGNVRVWDAECTLAGFLLSVILDDDVGGCDDVGIGLSSDGIDDGGRTSTSAGSTIELMRLREDLRSRLLTLPRRRRMSPLRSSYACGEDGDEALGSSSPPPMTTNDDDPHCNVLELGAGQAGLAGLAVASAASTTSVPPPHDKVDDHPAPARTTMRPLRLVLTDGHPRCVENNRVCAGLMMSSNVPRDDDVRVGGGADDIYALTTTTSTMVRIEVATFLWDSSPNDGAETCRRINALVTGDDDDDIRPTPTMAAEGGMVPPYHICLASDCVHFRDFHDGLLTSIARALTVDGIALLCQPRRGASLGDFMALVDGVNDGCPGGAVVVGDVHRVESSTGPLFRMTLHEDFNPKVSAMHRLLLSSPTSCSSVYEPNWHLPLLLVLQKLRPYDDDVDGERARRFVKMRSKQ